MKKDGDANDLCCHVVSLNLTTIRLYHSGFPMVDPKVWNLRLRTLC